MPTCLKEAAGGAGLNGLNHHLPRRRWPNNALRQGGHGNHGAGICLPTKLGDVEDVWIFFG
jgi:hypothetical protein